MILNVLKVFDWCLLVLKMCYFFFKLRLLFFDPWPLLAILKTLLSFLNLVQYIFTCVLKCCFHASYFFIHDCNTLGGNLIPYICSEAPCVSSSLELHPGGLNYSLALQRHNGQTAVLQALALGHLRSNVYSTNICRQFFIVDVVDNVD